MKFPVKQLVYREVSVPRCAAGDRGRLSTDTDALRGDFPRQRRWGWGGGGLVEPLDCPRQAWRLRQCPGRGDRRLCEEDSDTKISLFCSQRPPVKQNQPPQQLVLHEAKGLHEKTDCLRHFSSVLVLSLPPRHHVDNVMTPWWITHLPGDLAAVSMAPYRFTGTQRWRKTATTKK